MIDADLVSALRSVAGAGLLLVASDYDGVLAPIVDDPAAANPDADAVANLSRLGALADTYAVAISGRSLAELRRLSGNPAGVSLVGTHGAEEDSTDPVGPGDERAERLAAALEELAAQFPGAVVEAKPIGAAFHYRGVADRDAAARAARQIADRHGARTISGKMVVECLFGDADKGVAVQRLRTRLGASAVVFIGDDTTDEDAFAVLEAGDAGIKVGPGETLARYRIPGQGDVAAVLDRLLAERTRALSR